MDDQEIRARALTVAVAVTTRDGRPPGLSSLAETADILAEYIRTGHLRQPRPGQTY